MLPMEMKNLVLQTVSKIVPESNLENLNPDVRFRDQFDFDSMAALPILKAKINVVPQSCLRKVRNKFIILKRYVAL